MHWYDDAYHEIYNENTQRRGKVLLDLSNWLDAQLSS
jgi:alpha-beta hydrolase superfamily lysophospholipase